MRRRLDESPAIRRSTMGRALWFGLGCTALVLAVLGVVLPILPTTPFVLLAAACFARSSERLHRAMLAHRIAGPVIRDWNEHRSMQAGTKRWAYALMAISFGVSIALMPSGWHRLMLAATGLALALWLWRIPVRPPDPRP
jgi:uncharacterized membrane protein YbaN (DUF454 family)